MVDRIIQKGLSPHSDSIQDISIIPEMMLTSSRIELNHDLPLSTHQLKFTSLCLSMFVYACALFSHIVRRTRYHGANS